MYWEVALEFRFRVAHCEPTAHTLTRMINDKPMAPPKRRSCDAQRNRLDIPVTVVQGQSGYKEVNRACRDGTAVITKVEYDMSLCRTFLVSRLTPARLVNVRFCHWKLTSPN